MIRAFEMTCFCNSYKYQNFLKMWEQFRHIKSHKPEGKKPLTICLTDEILEKEKNNKEN